MRDEIKDQRALLLVEKFLSDVSPPRFLEARGENIGFDFVIGVKNPRGGLQFCAIEVKTTDRLNTNTFSFLAGRSKFLQTQNSNMPTVIFIVDTKLNELYYGFASEAKTARLVNRLGVLHAQMPVKRLQFDPASRRLFVNDILDHA